MEQSRATTISGLTPSELPAAANMVARSMAANPLHLAIFKNTSDVAVRKQEKMFVFALRMPHNKIYVVKDNAKIVGLMCYCSSDYCQMSFLQKLLSIPKMIPALG